MAAAETVVALVANNMANARTPGYKASSPVLVAQQPQTQSPGAAPDGASGGSNPVQVGTGVAVAAASTDFSQGSTTWRPMRSDCRVCWSRCAAKGPLFQQVKVLPR